MCEKEEAEREGKRMRGNVLKQKLYVLWRLNNVSMEIFNDGKNAQGKNPLKCVFLNDPEIEKKIENIMGICYAGCSRNSLCHSIRWIV